MKARHLFAAGLAALAVGGLFAAGPVWAEKDRARLRDQQRRINALHRNGKLSDADYRRLNGQERYMRHQLRGQHQASGPVRSSHEREIVDQNVKWQWSQIHAARHKRPRH